MLQRTLLILLLLVAQPIYADRDSFWQTKWSGAVYYGKVTQNTLGSVVRFDYDLDNDELYSFEIARYFREDGAVRQYWGPWVYEVGLVLNVTLHNDRLGNIIEIDPYITGKWPLLPENDWVKARIIIGEGLSWVSEVPYREYRNSQDPSQLLNFLMFEFSFAPAKHPEIELVYRLHHRSGVFGLYHANNSGSTAVGLVLRYYFDYTKPTKKTLSSTQSRSF